MDMTAMRALPKKMQMTIGYVWSSFSAHQISLVAKVGMCQLCGSWSVPGHNHRKVIGQDPICADLHGTCLGLSGNGRAEITCEEGD